jgi:hypothetical protein
MDATDKMNATPSVWAVRAYAVQEIKASTTPQRTPGSMADKWPGMAGFP